MGEPTGAEGNPAEIVVEVLGLDAPVRRDHPFEATTSRPARAGIRETSESGGSALAVGRGGCNNVNALLNPAISETAVSIDQQGWRQEDAETAAHGAEIIDRVVNRYIRLRLQYAGRDSGNRHYPNCAGRASGPRALDVRFDADEPRVSELKVVADLTAADKSGIAQGQNIGGTRGNRIGKRLNTCNGDARRGFHIDRIAASEG